MKRLRGWREILRASDGAEIAEAAVVLPLVFMLLFGIIWFGLAFNTYSTINSAAREGARLAARGTCATCGASFPTDQAVEDAVVAVLQASRADKTKIVEYRPTLLNPPTLCDNPAYPAAGCTKTTNNITICRFIRLTPSNASPQQCGVSISFQYQFAPPVPFPSFPSFASRQLTISAEGEARIQN